MSLAPITLPTDKSTAVIDNTHRSLRQDESGLSITVTVLNADNTAYNLTGKNLVFCENKQNNKIIIDNGHGDNCGTFIRNSDNDTKGIFTYVLQENVYANSGRAWFEITDGNTVDSTKNFYFDVETDAPISVTDNDYIGSLKALETAMAGAQDKVTSDLADMENQINKYIATTNTSSEAQITQAVKNLTDQTTEALSNVDQYTQKLATLQSQWDSELQSIQTKATHDTDSAVQAINDKYTNDFAQIKSDFTNWQTSTTQNYQKQVDDILAKVQADDTEVADVQKQVDDTVAKMQTLSQQFSNVDFTQFLKSSALDNYYTKAEIDPKLADKADKTIVNIATPLFRLISDSSSWQNIFGVGNPNSVLTSLRINPGPGPLLNSFAAGIGFGGWDTRGVLSVACYGHNARITGGNGDSPTWSEDIAWKSDITTLQGMVTSQGTAISQNTTAIATKANSSDVYTKSEIDPMIAPANWKIVDSVNVDTITYTSKLFITNVSGVPENNGGWGYLITEKGNSDSSSLRITQEWWSDRNTSNNQTTKHYYRQVVDNNGTWSSWLAQATQNDVDSLTNAIATKANSSDVISLQGRIAALQNAKPIMASSQDDAVAKSKNSNNEYYW